ncbi:MAG: oxygen-independent coproporphyrinogen III oxidase [Leptospira sp.]|nr:oxygen-independent coproporphyrinogen III oxidase [Leptospira sp.]
MKELLEKYDIPAPRYTSYPTVPYWTDNPTTEDWLNSLKNSVSKPSHRLSIYLHIPFCETLCTFCGCNTSITKNHSVESPYVKAIKDELEIYLSKIPELRKKEISELHLGGGSPTYLSEENLKILIEPFLSKFEKSEQSHYAIEVDPRRTRTSQLKVLYEMGFRRVSLGVQDFDPEVQRIVNRIQPFSLTEKITKDSRDLGYQSVNFDLIYGLPKQTVISMERTMIETLKLKPDRIAFYSYAHVPWIKASQRLFTEADLPDAKTKRELYELGRSMLLSEGYKEIGMDHFALPQDRLWISKTEGNLHRNFMGYADKKTDILLGLGSSAISETPDCYFQNLKLELKYRQAISKAEIPILRGHKLSDSDRERKFLILDLMTKWKVKLPEKLISPIKQYLNEMETDELIIWDYDTLSITDKGKPFLRLVAMAFDEKIQENEPKFPVFSKAL